MAHEYVNNGSDIYRESFRIIRSEADLDRFPADVLHPDSTSLSRGIDEDVEIGGVEAQGM